MGGAKWRNLSLFFGPGGAEHPLLTGPHRLRPAGKSKRFLHFAPPTFARLRFGRNDSVLGLFFSLREILVGVRAFRARAVGDDASLQIGTRRDFGVFPDDAIAQPRAFTDAGIRADRGRAFDDRAG